MTDTQKPPEYRQLKLSVRPIRFAVLMPDVAGWVPQARRVMENFSRTWGGCGDILIACKEDGSLSDTSWRLLELFDPDRLGYYVPTFGGMKRAAPELFESWVKREARRLARKSGGSTVEWKAHLTEDHFLSSPRSRWRPPDTTSMAALDRLAPLHWNEHVFQDAVTADWTPQHHFVDMAVLEPIDSSRIAAPDADGLPEELALLLETRHGQVAPSYEEALRKRGVQVERSPVTAAWLVSALQVAWSNQPHRSSFAWLAENEEPEPRWMLLDEQPNTPLGRTLTGCNWFRPWLSRWDERPFVFVVGNSLEDYSWALALDRMVSAAAWVPERLLRPRNARVAQTLLHAMVGVANEVTGYGHQERKVLLTSSSMPRPALNKVVGAAAKLTYMATSPFQLASIDEVFAQVRRLRGVERILDAERNEVIQYEPFDDGRQASLLNTPVPSAIPRSSIRVTWFVDVDIEGHRVPARSSLSELVVEHDLSSPDVRAARDGISYFSQTGFIASGTSVDKTLARPRLKLPSAATVFGQLLPEGWSCRPSQAGRYTRATLDILGGIEETATTLLNPAVFGVLTAFLSTSRSGVNPGIFLDTVKRRYLSFHDALGTSGLSSNEEARTLLDNLLLKGVLSRGLILDCGTCSYDGWYAMEDLRETFRCPRCRADTPITARAWKTPMPEPGWYYALSEVLYQFLHNNGHAPLLTLAKLKERTRAFMFEPEMDISDDAGWSCELDVWVIREGRITVGEAKTTKALGSNLETTKLLGNLRRAADAVHADEVVIATTKAAWSPSVEPQVRSAFADARQEVVLLSGLLV